VADQPSDRELLEQFEAELKRLKVGDLLVQTLYTVSSLGYRRLATEDRDLEQGRLAIDALRALLPVLKDSVPEEIVRDFNQVVANMQLTYAAALKESEEPDQPPESPEPAG
jgi:hypothetical protein